MMKYYVVLMAIALGLWSACDASKSLTGPTGGKGYHFLTCNIRLDTSSDGPDQWTNRKEALVKEIADRSPDVLGLQEVLLNQLQYFEEKMPGYQRVGVGRDDGKDKGEFSPVFFKKDRFELLEGRTFWLSPTPEQPSKGWDAALNRVGTLVVLKDVQRRDTIWVVNTHFDHMGKTARPN